MTQSTPRAALLGQQAPDFTLPSTGSEPVTLSSYRGHRHVVLVFYPLDFSPVCSMQLPEYSGRQDDFGDAGLDARVARAAGELAALAGRGPTTGSGATARRPVEDQFADPTPFDQLLRGVGVS